eukprot:scaffold3646_cov257-Chaetoceros_neogracile.AAC.6
MSQQIEEHAWLVATMASQSYFLKEDHSANFYISAMMLLTGSHHVQCSQGHELCINPSPESFLRIRALLIEQQQGLTTTMKTSSSA